MLSRGCRTMRFVSFCSASAPRFISSPVAYLRSELPFSQRRRRPQRKEDRRPPRFPPLRTVAHLSINIHRAHPDTAVPSASRPAANCSPVASPEGPQAHVLPFLPLATSHLVNCSPTAWENGLCFNRVSRIQEKLTYVLCRPARTRGLFC
jgi:hypothetical protein